MKTLHDGQTNDNELAAFTYEKPTDFQRVIWKILLRNSRNVVMAIQSQNLGPARRSNKVRGVSILLRILLQTLTPYRQTASTL
jgi:hypothetical protein